MRRTLILITLTVFFSAQGFSADVHEAGDDASQSRSAADTTSQLSPLDQLKQQLSNLGCVSGVDYNYPNSDSMTESNSSATNLIVNVQADESVEDCAAKIQETIPATTILQKSQSGHFLVVGPGVLTGAELVGNYVGAGNSALIFNQASDGSFGFSYSGVTSGALGNFQQDLNRSTPTTAVFETTLSNGSTIPLSFTKIAPNEYRFDFNGQRPLYLIKR